MSFEAKLTEEQIQLAQQHVKELKTRSHLTQEENWLISIVENAAANNWAGMRKETEASKADSKEDALKRLKALKGAKDIMHTIETSGHIVSDLIADIYRVFGIKCTSTADIIDGLAKAKGEPVDLIINSGGGDAYAGVEIYSRLKAYPGQLTAKVYSLAASAASIIAMGANSLLISPGGQIMIHNVSVSHAAGNANALSKTVYLLKNFDESLANIYTHKTGKTLEEVLALMDKETWFTAPEAIKHGLADGLLFYDSDTSVSKNTTVQKTSNGESTTANQLSNGQSEQMKVRLNQLKNKQFAADAKELEHAKAKLNLLKMKKAEV